MDEGGAMQRRLVGDMPSFATTASHCNGPAAIGGLAAFDSIENPG